MKSQTNISKSKRNYYVDIVSLLPFLMLLFTGIIMLMYHGGKPYSEATFNRDRNFWFNAHVVFAIITFVMTVIHLGLHLNWFKKLFSSKQKNKYWIRNLILIILFLVTALTSIVPWVVSDESQTIKMLLGLHNKFGLLLIIFFVIHLLTYSNWLINMTMKVFVKNPLSN